MQEEPGSFINSYKFRYDLNFYFNAKNIPNQNLVFETYNYFEKDEGKEFFNALDFLNLFYWNYQFLNANIEKPFDIINHLRILPLTRIEKHILIAFILKWFGGYPINNLNSQYNTTLKLIEELYLENVKSANGPLFKIETNTTIEAGNLRKYKDFINELDSILVCNTKREKINESEKLVDDKINIFDNSNQNENQKKTKIFLSHSNKDAEVVKEFTDKILQLILKINSDEIFCTSIEEFSITSGEDFRSAIKTNLESSSHVIQFITSNYKNSEVCLNEMGAAWVLSTKVKAFILEPITYDSVGFINSPNQLLKLDQKADLFKFIDDMKKDFSNTTLLTETNRHVQDFLESVIKYKTTAINCTNTYNSNIIQKIIEDSSEMIFFDLNNTQEYYIKGSVEQTWENDKPVGEKGKGRLQFKQRVINLERFNSDGRFLISFLRYLSSSGIKEYIESNIYNHSTRIIAFEFEAKIIGGMHTLLLVAKKANSTDWIHNANVKISVKTGDWEKFKEYIYIPSNENFAVFFDDIEIAKAPSSIQIRNLIIKESFLIRPAILSRLNLFPPLRVFHFN